jgi:hypothetical protein
MADDVVVLLGLQSHWHDMLVSAAVVAGSRVCAGSTHLDALLAGSAVERCKQQLRQAPLAHAGVCAQVLHLQQ